MDWKVFFKKDILTRGNKIKKEDFKIIKEDSEAWYAKINGTVEYDLKVQKDFKKIGCTCPYVDSGSYCKHMAFFLKYINENFKVINFDPIKEHLFQIDYDFKDKLISKVVDKNKLSEFLVKNTNLDVKKVNEFIDLKDKFFKDKGLIVEEYELLQDEEDTELVVDDEELSKYISEKSKTGLTKDEVLNCIDYEMEFLEYSGIIRSHLYKQPFNKFDYEQLKIKKDEDYFKKFSNINVNKNIQSLKAKNGSDYIDNEVQVFYVLSKQINQIKYISERLKHDRKFIHEIVKMNGLALKYLDKKYTDDDEIVFDAVRSNRWAFEYASERLRNNKELALIATKNDYQPARYIGNVLKNDKDFAIEILKKGGSLYYFGDTIRCDKEIALMAIKQSCYNFEYVSKNLKDDYDIILLAVKNNGENLRFASDRLKDDYNIVLSAIKQDYSNLSYASNRIKNSEEIACYMLNNKPKYKSYSSLESQLLNNIEFIKKVIKNYPNELENFVYDVSDKINNNKELFTELVKHNSVFLKYASDELLKDKEFIKLSLEIDINNIFYADISILKDKDFINNNICNKDKFIYPKILETIKIKEKENLFSNLLDKNNVSIWIRLIFEDLNIKTKSQFLNLKEEEFIKKLNRGIKTKTLIEFKNLKEKIEQK